MFPGGLGGILSMLGMGVQKPQANNYQGGSAGGAQMGMVDPQKLSKEQLDSWEGYDQNSDKSRLSQYHNAYAQQGNPAQQPNAINNQTPSAPMFGQFGDPKKAMGNIWEQLKGVPGKLKEGIGNIDKRMEANYAASGWGGEDHQNPYTKPSVTPDFVAGGAVTGDDIDKASTDEESYKKNVQSQLDYQDSSEGQQFLQNVNEAQGAGNRAVGNSMFGNNPLGGLLYNWLMPDQEYGVKKKHKYQGYQE
tara:strand:+ start:262 stop:1005 length:744 start_codon:yes stop_codon:yes gene_type:complete